MVSKINDLMNGILNNLEDSGEIVENPEAVLERIKVGLSIGYKKQPGLLNLINDSLKGEISQAVFLASHFLRYGLDIREIGLACGLDYINKVKEGDLENEESLFLIHSDFMKKLDKENARRRLEEKGGLEWFVLKLSGVDARYMSGMKFDHFEDVFDSLSERNWGRYSSDGMFHSEFEIDTGQVTAVSDGWQGEILENEDVKRVIEIFKGTEVIEIEDRYSDDDCYREGWQMNEHSARAWFGPFDEDDEEYYCGVIDNSNRPELIKRFLCHTMVLEGKAKELYQKYMDYQNKRFEGVKKHYENEFKKEHEKQFENEDEGVINRYIDSSFRQKTLFWMTILNTSINCLLDQGYGMPKIIEIAETQLNPFKNESWEIKENLKPILKRKYKD